MKIKDSEKDANRYPFTRKGSQFVALTPWCLSDKCLLFFFYAEGISLQLFGCITWKHLCCPVFIKNKQHLTPSLMVLTCEILCSMKESWVFFTLFKSFVLFCWLHHPALLWDIHMHILWSFIVFLWTSCPYSLSYIVQSFSHICSFFILIFTVLHSWWFNTHIIIFNFSHTLVYNHNAHFSQHFWKLK